MSIKQFNYILELYSSLDAFNFLISRRRSLECFFFSLPLPLFFPLSPLLARIHPIQGQLKSRAPSFIALVDYFLVKFLKACA